VNETKTLDIFKGIYNIFSTNKYYTLANTNSNPESDSESQNSTYSEKEELFKPISDQEPTSDKEPTSDQEPTSDKEPTSDQELTTTHKVKYSDPNKLLIAFSILKKMTILKKKGILDSTDTNSYNSDTNSDTNSEQEQEQDSNSDSNSDYLAVKSNDSGIELEQVSEHDFVHQDEKMESVNKEVFNIDDKKQVVTETETIESKHLEKKQLQNAKEYKYNAGKHFDQYISTISNESEEEQQQDGAYVQINKNDEGNFILEDSTIQDIKLKLSKIHNPTIKDLKKILAEIDWKYGKYFKYVMNRLNYKIPVISKENRTKIVEHFTKNKKKFSKCKTGKAPYKNFYDVCEECIKDLNLQTNLDMGKNTYVNIQDDTNMEDYLVIKKNQ
jgi:hypothetical protein